MTVQQHIPVQTRAVNKRNLIIQYGFELFCRNGYFNIRTTDIAAKAGVSIGNVYRYFPNKKALLLEALADYKTKHLQDIENSLLALKCDGAPPSTELIAQSMFEIFSAHIEKISHLYHDLETLAQSDADFDAAYKDFSNAVLDKIAAIFPQLGYNPDNIKIRTRIIFYIFSSYTNDVIINKNISINDTAMRKAIIQTLNCLFSY